MLDGNVACEWHMVVVLADELASWQCPFLCERKFRVFNAFNVSFPGLRESAKPKRLQTTGSDHVPLHWPPVGCPSRFRRSETQNAFAGVLQHLGYSISTIHKKPARKGDHITDNGVKPDPVSQSRSYGASSQTAEKGTNEKL